MAASPGATARPTGGPQAQRIPEGGNKDLERGLHTSVPVATGYALWPLPALDLQPGRDGVGWPDLPCSLWWMDGKVEDPSLLHEHPFQFLSASNFYNSRGVTVGWFDSKIVIFLLQKCLGQHPLLTESLPQKWNRHPHGAGCAQPRPSLSTPTRTPPVCTWAAHSSNSHPAEAAAAAPTPGLCCPVAAACALGSRAFSSFSSRNSRLTIYHD